MTTVIEAGNFRYVVAVFTATSIAPSAASTGVRFTLTEPDGKQTVVINGAGSVTGPVALTVNGLATTTWTWQTPVFTKPGRYDLAIESTAGIIAEHRESFVVPNYV